MIYKIKKCYDNLFDNIVPWYVVYRRSYFYTKT